MAHVALLGSKSWTFPSENKHLHHKETIVSMATMDKGVLRGLTWDTVKGGAGTSADLTSHLKTPPEVQKDTVGNHDIIIWMQSSLGKIIWNSMAIGTSILCQICSSVKHAMDFFLVSYRIWYRSNSLLWMSLTLCFLFNSVSTIRGRKHTVAIKMFRASS